MGFLTKFSLRNPVAVIILAVLLMFGGGYAYTTLKVDLLPNIEFPVLSVQTVYPGASPQDVDDKVTQVLEKNIKNVNGIKKLTSQSLDSVSLINIEFPLGTDIDKVNAQVSDAMKDAKLPENVVPKISRFSFGSFPIINVALFSTNKDSIQGLVEDDVKSKLEKIPGVASVSVGGTSDEFIQIVVNKDKAKENNITLNVIQQKIQGMFLSFPAGTVTQNSIVVPVKVDQKLKTIEELKKITFDVQKGFPPQPSKITLQDIADVKSNAEAADMIRYNMKDSLALTVTKKQDANTVEVTQKTYEVLNSYKDKMEYAIVFDQATGITESVTKLRNEGLFGALFASLAVLLFLRNIRATVIAILSIPLSLLITTIFLSRFGITLNIMTLGGMAVAVGRVVDDSIVVIENIFRRMGMEKGSYDREQLTLTATKEMLSAITSSTLTTIVVFLPLGFVGGITGAFFLPFALTVVFALLASLIVSVTIVPILAKFAFNKVKHVEREDALQRLYERVLQFSLKRKLLVILVSLGLLLSSFALVSKLGFVFIPDEKNLIVSATVTLPASTQLQKTNEVSKQVEQLFMNDKERIKYSFAQVGARDFQTQLKLGNQASYFISLNEGVDVGAMVEELKVKISDIVSKISPDATVNVQELSAGGPPSNNNVDVNLYSTDQAKLADAAKLVEEEMKKDEKLKYVKNNYRSSQSQWVVQIDPLKANNAGVSAFMVLGMISDQTRPVKVGDYTLNGKSQSIQLAYDRPVVSSSELESINLFGSNGPIQLKDIATVAKVDSVTSIQRLDGRVYASVTAQVDDKNVQAVSAKVKAEIAKLKLPDGVELTTGGGSDETTKTFIQLGIALMAAIGLVYLVMLVTFGKARIPFIILSSLLFIPVGALVGLYLTGQPLSVSAMIGLLMLVGIVVTNAIVLVDRVGQNRGNGMPIRESLMEAGKTRLRPILMTAFATICALTPLALTESAGNLISKGLAVVVIGGLLTSTLLTLVIVPIVYEIFFRGQRRREAR